MQHEDTHRTVLSYEPDTMVLPSGLMATLLTQDVCPSSVLSSSPEARSHTLRHVGKFRIEKISHNYKAQISQHETTHRTALSHEPDTMVLPSRLMATVLTLLSCPFSVLLYSPDSRTHTLVRVGRFRSKIKY